MKRLIKTSKKSGGPLSYAKKGQLTVRPMVLGGKAAMSHAKGYFPRRGK